MYSSLVAGPVRRHAASYSTVTLATIAVHPRSWELGRSSTPQPATTGVRTLLSTSAVAKRSGHSTPAAHSTATSFPTTLARLQRSTTRPASETQCAHHRVPWRDHYSQVARIFHRDCGVVVASPLWVFSAEIPEPADGSRVQTPAVPCIFARFRSPEELQDCRNMAVQMEVQV